MNLQSKISTAMAKIQPGKHQQTLGILVLGCESHHATGTQEFTQTKLKVANSRSGPISLRCSSKRMLVKIVVPVLAFQIESSTPAVMSDTIACQITIHKNTRLHFSSMHAHPRAHKYTLCILYTV